MVSQLLMLSPNLPKTQISYVYWGGGRDCSGDYVRHLIRIWSKKLDKNFFHARLVETNELVLTNSELLEYADIKHTINTQGWQ